MVRGGSPLLIIQATPKRSPTTSSDSKWKGRITGGTENISGLN